MKIPILNIYVMTEATLKQVIRNAVLATHKFSSEQVSLLLKENDRLAQGKPKKKLRLRRRAK